MNFKMTLLKIPVGKKPNDRNRKFDDIIYMWRRVSPVTIYPRFLNGTRRRHHKHTQNTWMFERMQSPAFESVSTIYMSINSCVVHRDCVPTRALWRWKYIKIVRKFICACPALLSNKMLLFQCQKRSTSALWS